MFSYVFMSNSTTFSPSCVYFSKDQRHYSISFTFLMKSLLEPSDLFHVHCPEGLLWDLLSPSSGRFPLPFFCVGSMFPGAQVLIFIVFLILLFPVLLGLPPCFSGTHPPVAFLKKSAWEVKFLSSCKSENIFFLFSLY